MLLIRRGEVPVTSTEWLSGPSWGLLLSTKTSWPKLGDMSQVGPALKYQDQLTQTWWHVTSGIVTWRHVILACDVINVMTWGENKILPLCYYRDKNWSYVGEKKIVFLFFFKATESLLAIKSILYSITIYTNYKYIFILMSSVGPRATADLWPGLSLQRGVGDGVRVSRREARLTHMYTHTVSTRYRVWPHSTS